MNFSIARQPSASVRVLVVDDSECWRDWLYSEFGRHGQFQIVGDASDGLEAGRKAHELRPDLVVLDISIPSLNGFEVARRIAQSTPDSKIVFLTAQNDPEIVKHALRNGADGYVLKEDAVTDLMAAIAAVLEGRRFVSTRLGMVFGRLSDTSPATTDRV
jgi:DNA-binding NarL/FixJ family response regulator